jgi:hypothetical protein
MNAKRVCFDFWGKDILLSFSVFAMHPFSLEAVAFTNQNTKINNRKEVPKKKQQQHRL